MPDSQAGARFFRMDRVHSSVQPDSDTSAGKMIVTGCLDAYVELQLVLDG